MKSIICYKKSTELTDRFSSANFSGFTWTRHRIQHHLRPDLKRRRCRMYPVLCLLALNFGHSSSQDLGALLAGEVSSEEVPETPKKWAPYSGNYEDQSVPEAVNDVGNKNPEDTGSLMTKKTQQTFITG